MAWRTMGTGLGVAAWLVACGPSGEMADTDGDTGSGTDSGSGSSTDTPATSPPATTSPPTTDSDSNSGDSSGDGPPPADGSDSGVATDDGATGDTGECPVGTEGCLCDIGSTCDADLTCVRGVCVGEPACAPIDTEAHGDEDTAVALDEIGCGQAVSLAGVGTVEGPQIDWFTFFGNDAGFCAEQPAAAVVASEDLVVCVHIECTSGGDVSTLNCAGDDVQTDSAEGRPGCCNTNAATIDGYDCAGFGGKDVDVYVSVASPDPVCVDYDLDLSL